MCFLCPTKFLHNFIRFIFFCFFFFAKIKIGFAETNYNAVNNTIDNAITKPISFSQGLDILLKNNAKIFQSNSVVLQFKALEAKAKGAALPSWSLLAALAPVMGGKGNAVTGETTPKKWGAMFLGEAEFLVPVFAFGRIRNSKKAANLGVSAALHLKQDKVNNMIFAYKKVYLSLILLQRYKSILDDAKEKLDTVISQAKELYAKGEGKVQTKDISRLKIARIELLKLEEEWQLNQKTASLGLGHLLGKRDMLSISDTDFPSSAQEIKTLDVFIRQGYEKNPLWQAANLGVRASNLQLKAQKRINYPVVAVGARLNGAATSGHTNQKSPYAYDQYNMIEGTVFIGARWQFDFSKQKSEVGKAQAKLTELEGSRLEAYTGIPFEISVAYWKIEKFKKNWRLSMKKYKEASKWALSELNAYSLGATDAKDLLEAFLTMNMAAQEMAQAEYDYNLALAELALKVGENMELQKWEK